MSKESTLVIPFNLGINDAAIDETLGVNFVRASKNTRFTVQRGMVRKAPALQTFDTSDLEPDALASGQSIVPIAGGRESPLALSPSPAFYVQDDGLKSLLGAQAAGQLRQSSFYPLQVVAGGSASCHDVVNETLSYKTCVLNGPNLWVLSQGSYDDRPADEAGAVENNDGDTGSATNFGLYLTVIEAATGRVLAPSTRVLDNSSTTAFAQASGSAGPYLTCHADESKAVLWYVIAGTIGSAPFHALELSLAAGTVTVGADNLIYTGGNPIFCVSSEGSYGEGFADHAWLFCRKFGSSTDMILMKVNVTTWATHNATTITAGASPLFASVSGQSVQTALGPVELVSWIFSCDGSPASSTGQTLTFDGTTLSALYSPKVFGPLTQCPVSVTHYHHGQAPCALFICSPLVITPDGDSVGESGAYPHLTFESIELISGSYFDVVDSQAEWQTLYGQAKSFRMTSDAGSLLRPLVPSVRQYNGVQEKTDALYVPDQTGTLYTVNESSESRSPADENSLTTPSPIGRFGWFAVESKPRWGQTLSICDAQVAVGYTVNPALESARTFGQSFRFMVLAPQRRALSAAYDDTGVAIASGALPVYWDGFEVAELGALHQPVINVKTDSGSGFDGSYSFVGLCYWYDAQGQLHRSAPSTPVVIDLTDKTPIAVYLTLPATLKNGVTQRAMRAELYCQAPGAAGHSLMIVDTNRLNPATTINGTAKFQSDLDSINTTERLLYTDSGELSPVCPPAAWTVSIVGQRAWLVSAEQRGRVFYSKLKQPGIAFEFPGEFTILFPASAGSVHAVIEVDGNPIFLAENGVFYASGPGPDNSGGGVEYSDPRRISDIGCWHRDSVVRTPMGTLFASRDCFAIVKSGGEVTRMIEVKPSTLGECVGTALFADTQEAVFFGDGSGSRRCLVFNYEAGRWSEWTHFDGTVFHGVWSPDDRVAVVSHADSSISRIDPLAAPSIEANTHVQIETGWLQPSGPQGACQLRELIIEGYLDQGNHGLRVTAYLDYSEEAESTIVFNWSADDIEDATVNGRYTLQATLNAQPARALKLVFLELDGNTEDEVTERGAFNPLHVTLTYSPAEGVQRTFKPSAMK